MAARRVDGIAAMEKKMSTAASACSTADQPLYLNRVEEAYGALPRARQVVFLDVVNRRGDYAQSRFQVPCSDDCDSEALDLRERYLLARFNNLFATFGGARLTIYAPRNDGGLMRSLERALERFAFPRRTNDRAGLGSFANYMARINRAVRP
ncbi:MAG: hypothetical protein LBT97_12740 [Planctomycetota bacterium]|jgi:hypothetical protein|nr:hypothetical protein [Planctomycetota bacterium]